MTAERFVKPLLEGASSSRERRGAGVRAGLCFEDFEAAVAASHAARCSRTRCSTALSIFCSRDFVVVVMHHALHGSIATSTGGLNGYLEPVKDLNPERTKLQPVRARMLADQDPAEEALAELSKLSNSTWRSCAADLAEVFEVHLPAVARDLYERLAEEREAQGTRAARKKAALFRVKLAELGGRDG